MYGSDILNLPLGLEGGRRFMAQGKASSPLSPPGAGKEKILRDSKKGLCRSVLTVQHSPWCGCAFGELFATITK